MNCQWYTIGTERKNSNAHWKPHGKRYNMTQVLEAAMLICFGISWPLSVVKNIKAHSAKGMSPAFILLIMTGYVAGITAKVLSGAINYVLAVYILNLAIVSVNLVIYFINRRYDREAEKKMVKGVSPVAAEH